MASKKQTKAETADQTESTQTTTPEQTPAATETATKPAKAEKAPKPPKDERNGVTRPTSGVTRKVWDVADALAQKLARPPERKEVTEECEKDQIALGTVHTQYGRWRKYYGLSTPRAAAAPATEQPQAEGQEQNAE